uniref:Alpha-glucosidase n=1 Tax=uncultured Thiotrichaceae bacterium TaxID=298394 RepID=A0A6S6SWT5_9GAMM|nr:MAG: Alpha-glucosidase [uncultured Thiotrichaceae bacterium]
MVWDADQVEAGFTSGKPWLPVKAPQLSNDVARQVGKADSVLEFYRTLLKIRKGNEALRTGRSRFFNVPEPLLAFGRDEQIFCIYNLSAEPQRIVVAEGLTTIVTESAELEGNQLTLGANGFGWFRMAT